jgi:Bacterial Ig domain
LTVHANLNPDGTLMVTGHGEPGSSVTVTFPDGTMRTVLASEAGDYCALTTCRQPSGTISAIALTVSGHVTPAALMPYSDGCPVGDGSSMRPHTSPLPDGLPYEPLFPDLASSPGEQVARAKLDLELVREVSGDGPGPQSAPLGVTLVDVMQAPVPLEAPPRVFGFSDSHNAPVGAAPAFQGAELSLSAVVLSANAALPIDHMASAHIL